MKKKSKHLSFKTALFKGAYVHNTVLTGLAGLCPIAAVCVNTKIALLISAMFSLILIVCEVISSAFFKKTSRWIRVCIYALISGLLLLLPMLMLEDQAASALGVYLPLLCVSGVIVIRCEKFAVRTTVYNAFVDSVASCVGFTAVALTVGTLREIISTGKILGIQTHIPNISAIAMPFGGLLILGFAAAFHKWSIMKFFPKEIVDTFDMKSAQEIPVIKDPGLKISTERKQSKKLSQDNEEYLKIRPRYSIEDIDADDVKSTEVKQ